MPPDKIRSGASLGKAYLKAMGIVGAPPLVAGPSLLAGETPDSLAGYARAAFFAGRMECPIRLAAVPIVPLDARSMYGHIAHLTGSWWLIVAEKIAAEDATEDARRLLSEITPSDLLKPETWRGLNILCLLDPKNDVLPVRTHEQEKDELCTLLAEIAGGPACGQWYGLPDCIASKVKTGRAPLILRAIRFRPEGLRQSLRPTILLGTLPIDPARDDLFSVALSERAKLLHSADSEAERTAAALKIILSSTGYGIWGEEHSVEPHPMSTGRHRHKVRIFAGDERPTLGTAPRAATKGDYYCPIIATLTTSGARLMLALMEHVFEEAGVVVANVVTDGLAIVATETGGLIPCEGGAELTKDGKPAIRALSWTKVDELRKKVAHLSPFGDDFLRVDKPGRDKNGEHRQAFFYGVSTLRYCLFAKSGKILKASGHVLGSYEPPTNRKGRAVKAWLKQAWQHILSTDGVLKVPEPQWIDDVAFVKRTITHPSLLKRLAAFNNGKSYAESAKAFGFYLEAAGPLSDFRSADEDEESDLGKLGKGLIVIERDTDDRGTWLCWDAKRKEIVRLVHPNEDKVNAGKPTDEQPWYKRLLAWQGRPDTLGIDPPREAAGVTWRRILEDYASHPERKLLDANGKPCERWTRGLLRRRTVRVVDVEAIGRSKKGLKVPKKPEPDDELEAALAWFRALPAYEIAERFGYSPRMAKYIRDGVKRPSAEKMALIVPAYRKTLS